MNSFLFYILATVIFTLSAGIISFLITIIIAIQSSGEEKNKCNQYFIDQQKLID